MQLLPLGDQPEYIQKLVRRTVNVVETVKGIGKDTNIHKLNASLSITGIAPRSLAVLSPIYCDRYLFKLSISGPLPMMTSEIVLGKYLRESIQWQGLA